MQKNDDGSIRYLMKEMDPSEEIEFEREMMKDENLLIEVETLRKTFQRLGQLPLHHPSPELTQKVKDEAVKQQRLQILSNENWVRRFGKTAAAAAILLMVASGSYWYGSTQNSTPASTGIQAESGTMIMPKLNKATGQPEPWIDQNQVIRFAGTSNQPEYNQVIQTEIDQSYNKLQLVNDQTGFSQPTQKILLTNSVN